LQNLAANADNKVEMGKQGGLSALVRAMALHRDNAGVQEKGCAALLNLAVNDANEVEIGKNGGIDAIVKALELHRGNVSVREKGCKALLSFAHFNDDSRDKLPSRAATRGPIHDIYFFSKRSYQTVCAQPPKALKLSQCCCRHRMQY
jgi:hypothetical protein